MPTLILTPRFTDDSQALWRAAGRLEWNVQRLSNWRVPPELLTVDEPVLYVEGLFGPTIAQQFGLRLPEPPNDWLPRLPEEYRKRDVRLTTLGEARRVETPAFIKPPNVKSFPAQVYVGAELPLDFDDQEPTLISEVVEWEKEFRFFLLDRRIQAMSIYLRLGQLQRDRDFAADPGETAEAVAFVERVLADPQVDLPRAAVVDVGVIAGRGWAVVEQNAAWGSGIYGCDPLGVLPVLRHAAVRPPVDGEGKGA